MLIQRSSSQLSFMTYVVVQRLSSLKTCLICRWRYCTCVNFTVGKGETKDSKSTRVYPCLRLRQGATTVETKIAVLRQRARFAAWPKCRKKNHLMNFGGIIPKGFVHITHMLHVWYIYLHDWVIFRAHVGKYTSTMEQFFARKYTLHGARMRINR